ncbi:MAG: ATP-binding protein [Candidatus Parcubacteria bacterium]|nr:ATP-binding protein [Candidatus Parcubacteria bacterium]
MKKFLKIGTRITFTFTSLFVVLVLTGGFFLQRESAKRSLDLTYENLKIINESKKQNIQSLLENEKEMVAVLAVSPTIQDLLLSPEGTQEKQKVVQKLQLAIEQAPEIRELMVLDKNGKIISTSNKEEKDFDKSEKGFFLHAKNETHIEDFSFSKTFGQNLYSVSSPAKNINTEEFLGVVVAQIYPKKLYEILSPDTSKKTEENFLINSDLYFVSGSRFLGNDIVLKKKNEKPNMKDCFMDRTAFSSVKIKNGIDYRNVRVIGAYSYIPGGDWCLAVEADESEILTQSNQMAIIFLIAGLLSSFLFVLIGYLISRRITKPLEKLREGVEVIEKGNMDFKVGISGADEIATLSRAFDEMTSSLKKTREEIDKKVKEQTYEITRKAEQLETQQKATLNILSDIEREKEKAGVFARDLEKFKLAVDTASDGVVISDSEGIILYTNKGSEKITGFSQKEVIGQKAGSKKNWGGLEDTTFYKNLWDIIKTQKKTYVGGLKNCRKDGEKYDALLHISPILDKSNEIKFFVAIERDISKEKMIDRSKTEFVSLASHQLRTPLSFVNWYSEMLLGGEVGPLNEKQKKYLEEIYAGNQRMIELVNSLLNVSRLDLGTFVIEPMQINIQEMTKSLLKELRPQSEKKHIVIQEDYDSIPPTFLADPKLLRMVFQNLLSNAIKYTQDSGTVTLNVQKVDKKIIFAGQEMKEENLVISVSDTGMGIPDEQKDKIFTKLFRTDNAKVSEAEGNGLGLYIIKSVIDQSGGQIWFDSKENQGSTFYVSFPLSGMKKKEGTKKLD